MCIILISAVVYLFCSKALIDQHDWWKIMSYKIFVGSLEIFCYLVGTFTLLVVSAAAAVKLVVLTLSNNRSSSKTWTCHNLSWQPCQKEEQTNMSFLILFLKHTSTVTTFCVFEVLCEPCLFVTDTALSDVSIQLMCLCFSNSCNVVTVLWYFFFSPNTFSAFNMLNIFLVVRLVSLEVTHHCPLWFGLFATCVIRRGMWEDGAVDDFQTSQASVNCAVRICQTAVDWPC